VTEVFSFLISAVYPVSGRMRSCLRDTEPSAPLTLVVTVHRLAYEPRDGATLPAADHS